MKTYKRFLLLLLVVALFCVQFSIIVNAGNDGNIINSNLTQWHNIEGASTVDVYGNNNVYRLNATGGSVGLFSGVVYDLPSFVAGHSYTLKFRLPSAAEIAKAYNVSFTDSQLKAYYKNSEISVGYGFVSADGNSIISPVNLFTFNSSNISRYVGTNLSTTFVAGSASGRPCVYIQLYSSDSGLHLFYFSEFVLFDNDDNSKELTGIKGFLHSIRWDLVGGTCDEEDCPHSSNVNPHLSLTQRMTEGFSLLLNKIGDKFEDGSTLNIWFNNLSDKFEEGSVLSGWFVDLSDKFEKGSTLETWFDGIKAKFKDVGDSIELKFQNIADSFTDLFDKFKPRVNFEFAWYRGIINWNTGEVTYRNDDYQYVIVSDLFIVPVGSDYLLNYSFDGNSNKWLAVHKYDLDGNYVGVKTYGTNLVDFQLQGGYQYRFRTERPPYETDISTVMNELMIVHCDTGWINAMLHKTEIKLTALFVPRDYFMENYSLRWEELMVDRFGAVVQCGSVLTDFFSSIIDYSGDEKNTISVPSVSIDLPDNAAFTFGGFDVIIVNEKFEFLQNAVKVLVGILATFGFIYGLRKRYDEVMGVEH